MPKIEVSVIPTLRAYDIEVKRPTEWTGSYTEGGAYVESIANGVVDQSMNMLGVTTATVVMVQAVNGQITVKLNNAAGTAIVLSSGGFVLLAGAAITAIFVSNASGAAVTVSIVVVG